MLTIAVAYLSGLPTIMVPIIPMDPMAVIIHIPAILTTILAQSPRFRIITAAPTHQGAVSTSGLAGSLYGKP